MKIAETAIIVDEKEKSAETSTPSTANPEAEKPKNTEGTAEAPAEAAPKKKKNKRNKKKGDKDGTNASFNIDAPVFTPTFTPAEGAITEKAEPKNEPVQLPRAVKVEEPQADFGGYQNRHLTNPVEIAESRIQSLEETAEAESKKVYSLQFMLSLRQENK